MSIFNQTPIFKVHINLVGVTSVKVKGEISIQWLDPRIIRFVGKLGSQTANVGQETT